VGVIDADIQSPGIHVLFGIAGDERWRLAERVPVRIARRRGGQRVVLAAHEHRAFAGQPVVEQWQVSRDLFVVLEGEVEVTQDGAIVRTLHPGDFFGELAAMDWGAGFGRTRSATVRATVPTRLLVLDAALVNWLTKADDSFAQRLEAAARQRLATPAP
jgi:CRP-like cAMP-binding protein